MGAPGYHDVELWTLDCNCAVVFVVLWCGL